MVALNYAHSAFSLRKFIKITSKQIPTKHCSNRKTTKPDEITGDLVYFTIRVLNTSDTSSTWATQVQREYNKSDTSETRPTRVLHDCFANNTSETRVKNFDFYIETRVKTCIRTPILAISLTKDYKERNHFILRTTCWMCTVLKQKCYIKKLYTRL